MLAGGSGPGGSNAVPGSNPTGTGSGINYIGKLAYAQSGAIEVDNNQLALVTFQSGTTILKGQVQFFYAESSNDIFMYTVKSNSEIIAQYFVFGPGDTNGEHLLSNPINLIVPPYTKIQLLAQNVENSNSRKQCATFMGEII